MKSKNQIQNPAQPSNNASIKEEPFFSRDSWKKFTVPEDIPYFITHTHEESIEAGFLIDVTNVAKNIGFNLPVALTKAVWGNCVTWDASKENRNDITQSEGYRLLELLSSALIAWRQLKRGVRCSFDIYRALDGKEKFSSERVVLSIYTNSGFISPKRITIMMDDESLL